MQDVLLVRHTTAEPFRFLALWFPLVSIATSQPGLQIYVSFLSLVSLFFPSPSVFWRWGEGWGCWHWWITWGFCCVVLSLCEVAPTCVCIISGLWLIRFQCWLKMHWLWVFLSLIIGRISFVKVMNIPFNTIRGTIGFFRTLRWYIKIDKNPHKYTQIQIIFIARHLGMNLIKKCLGHISLLDH